MKPVYKHYDLENKEYVRWRDFLHDADSWSLPQIQQYQQDQLAEVVRHAYQSTAGYRRLWDAAGFDPQAPLTPESFRQLPMVEKETIRDHLDEFTAFKGRCKYVTTGGSTGIPFGFYRENKAFARELASKAHQYRRIGWEEGQPQLVFRGLAITAKSRVQFYPRFNELRCSSYHLTPDQMERYRLAAIKYQPQWLRCYPSSGYRFAKFIEETGGEFPHLKGILCASENLYDYQKEALKRTFNCRVFSHYGHYELAVLAGFCEHEDTYHVMPQYGFAELLDPQGNPVTTPGQMGEIVATSFFMRATPFIRYRTRDFAVYQGSRCEACGRPFQIWDHIEGRLQEFIITRNNRLISMTAINMHDNIFDHIKQFQFIQEQKGVVTFTYMPKATCNDAIIADVLRRLMVKFGDDVELVPQPVAEIPATKRGKHRFLIQKLPLEHHDF